MMFTCWPWSQCGRAVVEQEVHLLALGKVQQGCVATWVTCWPWSRCSRAVLEHCLLVGPGLDAYIIRLSTSKVVFQNAEISTTMLIYFQFKGNELLCCYTGYPLALD